MSTETIDESPRRRAAAGARAPLLFAVLEADRLDAGGSRHVLTELSEVELGRGDPEIVRARTTLRLRLPASALSTRHARLIREGTRWFIEDLGSKNGTFVNGTRLERTQLTDGDLIELGRCYFVFRDTLEIGAATPPDLARSDLIRSPAGFRTLLPEVERELNALRQLAATEVPILLMGATGTGKEVVARAIHGLSGARGPFVGVNCGALAPNLVESALFGHVKGAFSGASRDEPGFLRAANGGTLLLDELGELPATTQVSLLRALETREVIPVGSTAPLAIDGRFIGATNRSLEAMVQAGSFRADLYARLRGHTHFIPTLKDRREDLGNLVADILADGFNIESPRGMAAEAARWLLAHTWPMNVRELVQSLRTAVYRARGERIELEHLGADAAPDSAPVAAGAGAPALSAEDAALRAELLGHLTAESGNVAAVARAMGKAPVQIHRWMKRFGLSPDDYRS